MYDVSVVGGGPGGSAAARKCAQRGLKVLLLEKHRLPRDKVCTGLLASPLAQELVSREFGPLPQEVTVFPHWEQGFMLHIPGVPDYPVGARMPIAWRRELDFWMNQKVLAAGAELWDGARVEAVQALPQGYELSLKRGGREQRIAARFLVGADGSLSTIRSWLFSQLKVAYAHCYQEGYPGARLELSADYVHAFFLPELAPYYFDAYYKDDMVLVEVTCRVGGGIRQLMARARDFLARNYGLVVRGEAKREACTEPLLFRELLSGGLVPARGNALLVGDAAGLQMPVTAEGINTAIHSGLAAAEAILQASQSGQEAAAYYQQGIAGILSALSQVYSWTRKVREATSPQGLAQALGEAWGQGLAVRF